MRAESNRLRTTSRKLGPYGVSLLIVVLVFVCTVLVRQMGWLQFLEFKAYDAFIRQQPKASTSDPIVLVEMTEADINDPSLDYPIHDFKLAELLRNLVAAKPAAIGLDVWRDIAVPKSGTGLPQLNDVLQAHPNIIAIFTLDGIPAPAVLRSNSDRIAFNDDFPVDVGVDSTIPKVRRCMLFEDRSGESFDALPFKLALLYLQPLGIQPGPVPDDPRAFRLGKTVFRPFQPNDGAYIRADARGWQMLLDFKCPNQFTRFSVGDALAGRIPAGSLTGKIVLVGMNSASVSDERVTPVQRNHRGIELQALTANQLLREALNGDAPLRAWAGWLGEIWILLWCVIGGAIGFWIRSPWRFALAVVVSLLGLTCAAWLAFNHGWWIPAITPAVGFVPATALVVSYISSQERSMRHILMKLYSRQVSKEIAEAVWENRDSFMDGRRPRAQKLVVTVLFTDLKGFSTISEKMEASRLYIWLNGYLGAMASVIQDHGGVLKQFSGDGILALFGVPLPHTTPDKLSNDAIAGVRCALGMGRRLVELNRVWESEGLPAVSMRAGIYTGEVAAGSVGSDDRFEYTVIGDVVNTASRLESYDKSFANPDSLPTRCRLLAGAPTHALLDGKFLSEEIGLIEVKGKANKVPVFQILGEKTAAVPVSSMSAPSQSTPKNDSTLIATNQQPQTIV